MQSRSLLAALMLFTALTLAPAARAGRSCEPHRATVASVERGLRLAQRTHEALEAQHALDGTRLVLMARAGRDLTRYGLRYSHGHAWRTVDGGPAGLARAAQAQCLRHRQRTSGARAWASSSSTPGATGGVLERPDAGSAGQIAGAPGP
jgi:hypothetical protein